MLAFGCVCVRVCVRACARACVRTSAAAQQGVVRLGGGAEGLDPVCVVLLVLDHPTDVDELEGALVQ